MKERPILFSAPMVRAILKGRKGRTRRPIVSPYKKWPCFLIVEGEPGNPLSRTVAPADEDFSMGDNGYDFIACPFGQPGDRLWVRETWALHHEERSVAGYSATDKPNQVRKTSERKADGSPLWRPSIHMPRWASRLTLAVTGVRIEQLHDITEKEARLEGAELTCDHCGNHPAAEAHWMCEADYEPEISYREGFRRLWNATYGPKAWDLNPWVWVVEFPLAKSRRAWKDAVALAATLEPAPAGRLS